MTAYETIVRHGEVINNLRVQVTPIGDIYDISRDCETTKGGNSDIPRDHVT